MPIRWEVIVAAIGVLGLAAVVVTALLARAVLTVRAQVSCWPRGSRRSPTS